MAPSAKAPAQETTTPPLSGDLLAVRQAIDLVRGGKSHEATVAEKAIGDSTAQKLVEWFILRHAGFGSQFQPICGVPRR